MDLGQVWDQLLPFCYQRQRVETIQTRIENERSKEQDGIELPYDWTKYESLSLAELTESHKSELARREGWLRRAQAFLGTVALMSAFTIGAIGLVRNQLNILSSSVVGAGILATLAYLAGAAWFALKVLQPGQIYDIFLQNRIPDDAKPPDAELKRFTVHAIRMNQAFSLVFSIYSDRSFRCLRNGVVSLVLVLAGLAVDQVFCR